MKPRVNHRLVFLAQRVGEPEQEFLVVLVVFVLVRRHGARGRDDREERAFHLHAAERGFEIVDVALDRGLPLVGDRRHDGRHAARRQFLGVEILLVEFGEFLAVRARAGRVRDIAFLDAAKPLQHIGRPGAEFSELAVTDKIDTGFGLLAHNLLRRSRAGNGLNTFSSTSTPLEIAVT